MNNARRGILGFMTGGLATLTLGGGTTAQAGSVSPPLKTLIPEGTPWLSILSKSLEKTPRRRDFKSVPMILTRPEEWDDEALRLIFEYQGQHKQVFDNMVLDGPWLNLMRNSLNSQIWAFGHKDFLVVSGTHGPAHLALYDDYLWDKYQLSQLTQGKFKDNSFLKVSAAAQADPAQYEDITGVFSPLDNSIPVLQSRGIVFLACHNAIFELATRLHQSGTNPDHQSIPQLAAELTNHLIDGAVLTPGVMGTMPELGARGFYYAK
ncbi:hypothetical protein [Ferrovum sp.]|uniref:thiosulfate dehydrogenase n=1 Tax=Ferrovum sp. TaxID=2609467 RepID=UPI0026394D03|nr:hypothetical protein [Ferrovum sp.]